MANINRMLFLFSLPMLVISCGSDSEVSDQSIANTLPEYQLTAADSFGVEFGDSISMIGSINGFCYHNNGSILILDRCAMRVRVISDDGEVTCWGRSGEGPGEFLFPYGICVMQDGRVLVSDSQKREVMEFNVSGNYSGSYIIESEESVPVYFYPVDSNSIVGTRMDTEFLEDQILCSYYVGRFDSDVDPTVKYAEIVSDISSPDFYTEMELIDFYADQNGRVYLVSDNSEYNIKVLSAGGSVEYEIIQDVERLPKSGEQIQLEIDEFEEFALNYQINLNDYKPNPYFQLFSLIGVDSEQNLWVQRFDSENGFIFDVFDTYGNLVFTVSVPGFSSDIEMMFRVDRNGILGSAAEPYPRVYSFILNRE